MGCTFVDIVISSSEVLRRCYFYLPLVFPNLPDRRMAGASLKQSAGNRRDNADGVPIFSWRIFLGQVANVFVVHVHIHKAAQLAIFSEEMFAQVAKLAGQLSESFADSFGGNFSRIGLACIHAQWRGNNHFYRHLSSFLNALVTAAEASN